MKDVAFGLAAGALGAIIWAIVAIVTQYEIGWIAWGVGALVGYAVAAGNRDKHRSPTAAGVLAVAITALSLVAGKYAATEGMMPSDEEIVAMFTQDFENEDFVVSYVADEVVGEFVAAGRAVDWPAGVDPSNASSEYDYPEEVWVEAETRWSGWTEAERQSFRGAKEGEVRSNVEASLPEIRAAFSAGGFAGSFSPMDFIFFGLGMVTAWGMGSGKKAKEQIQGEYLQAVRAAMLRVMLADGSVEDEEVQVAVSIYQQMTGEVITPDEMRADVAVAQSSDLDLMSSLEEVGPHVNENGRAMVVKAALLVALADQDFAAEEQQLVHGISRAIGLSDEEFRGVLAEVMEAQDEAAAESDAPPDTGA